MQHPCGSFANNFLQIICKPSAVSKAAAWARSPYQGPKGFGVWAAAGITAGLSHGHPADPSSERLKQEQKGIKKQSQYLFS